MKRLQLVVVAAFIFQTGASQCEGEQKYSMGAVIIEDKPLRVLYVLHLKCIVCNSMISVTKRTKICLWSHGEKHNEMVMVTTPIFVIKLSIKLYLCSSVWPMDERMKSLWVVVVAGFIFSLLQIGTCQCDGENCMIEITRDSKMFYISQL